MKRFSFERLLFTLIALLFVFVYTSCTSDDELSKEEESGLQVSQVVGCWKVAVSDTVTDYWQFSTAVESDVETQSRLISIDTPSGTYINTRVTENAQNHTRVMKLLSYGAYMVNSLRNEILMTQGSLSDYSTNFKVTLIDDKMTLDSIGSQAPLVLVNVNRIDSNNDSDYAKSFSKETYFSVGGYKFSINNDWCTFIEHPLFRGRESELLYYDVEAGQTQGSKNIGKVFFERIGKNMGKIVIQTSESINDQSYYFDQVRIEIKLQFWGNGYGVIKGGHISRSGKYYDGYDTSECIVEEDMSPDYGLFGTFPY